MTKEPSAPSEHFSSLTEATASALDVLDRFHQRHKNQHHVARWWSQLGILRRSLQRLIGALDAHRRQLIYHQKTSASRKKPSSKSAAALLPLQESVLHQARWCNDTVLPRAYMAFTQLSADQQHAPLGLFLVALVAFLSSSLVPLFPQTEAAAESPQLPRPAKPSSPMPDDLDLGVAISRDHVDDAPLPVSRTQSCSPPAVQDEISRPKEVKKVKERPAPAAAAANTKPLKRARPQSSKPEDPKPKKKKKAKKDEFASLFGSLL